MIPNKIRESRRVKALKLPKNLERLYKKGKCRECAVVVTRMDFAKILGKFTKVKIQYESSTTPKTKQNSEVTSPNSNARLKSNENGMVLIHRNAYSQHPVKELTTSKKTKNESPRVTPQVLKENNRLKKSTAAAAALVKDKNANYNDNKKVTDTNQKRYVIVFEDPINLNNNNNDLNCKVSLSDLLSHINDTILPAEDWCIDFFPKKGEPKDDKVYERIAAELEDLMYSEKPTKPNEKVDITETKVDDFPSIMDILNDNSSDNKTNDQSSSLEFKSNLESSDVEAMLLGKTNPMSTPLPPTPMDVDNADMGNLIEDVNQLTVIQDSIMPDQAPKISASEIADEIENPQSPSILDEALQKGIEEHLPCNSDKKGDTSEASKDPIEETLSNNIEKKEDIEIKVIEADVDQKMSESEHVKDKETISLSSIEGITHLVFKQTKDGACFKSVTCPKNLKYDIEIDGKSVEFIGAPKLISNSDDLQILLEIVNESNLSNMHVLH